MSLSENTCLVVGVSPSKMKSGSSLQDLSSAAFISAPLSWRRRPLRNQRMFTFSFPEEEEKDFSDMTSASSTGGAMMITDDITASAKNRTINYNYRCTQNSKHH